MTKKEREPSREGEDVLAYVRTATGASNTEIARALGRDRGTLASSMNGEARLRDIAKLAEMARVPRAIFFNRLLGPECRPDLDAELEEAVTYERADSICIAAFEQPDNQRALRAANSMLRLAGNDAAARSKALRRRGGALEQLGHLDLAAQCFREGLRQPGIDRTHVCLHKVNLASVLMDMEQPVEAHGIAVGLREAFEKHPPRNQEEWSSYGLALYVEGFSRLEESLMPGADPTEAGESALTALSKAISLFAPPGDPRFDHAWYEDIGNSCVGGCIFARTLLGEVTPAAALAEIEQALPEDIAAGQFTGQRLESWARWALIGSYMIARYLDGPEAARRIAFLQEKIQQICERRTNWVLWRRFYTFELEYRRSIERSSGLKVEWSLDEDQREVICGLMIRFPEFHEAGWQILERARVA